MTKITEQEFKNYSDKFLSVFTRMMDTPDFKNVSKEEQEKVKKMLGVYLNKIELGNVAALWSACVIAESALSEDFSAIKNRAKEHVIARGYYNPTSPLTLAEFRERRKKIGCSSWNEFWKNKERRYQLLSEMSEEDYNFVYGIGNFIETVDKIFPEGKDEKMTEEQWQSRGFIWEDILKVLEKAHKKMEQSKQNDSRERERERERVLALPLPLTPLNRMTVRQRI